jgi:alkylation response protein AidB-like acyl-CoA dehydrogenase
MLGPVLVEVGTHEQKLEHLVPMMRGEQRWCQGFSEPNAGSDLASLKTSARRVSDEQGEAYIVNGGKIWTSDGDKGDWMYALVRTSSEGKKQDGISFLLIDMKSPGVTVKPIELISGKSSFCQVFFDDVRVPVRQLVGKEGEGWSLAKKLLQHERAAMSKFTEGGAPSHDALTTALPYMVDEQGQISDGVLREKLAGLLMDAQSFALTHRRVTEKALARQDVASLSSIMKLVQTEQEVAKYELLEQVLGLRGLGWEAGDCLTADEIDIGRAWLRSKSYTIAGGSSEVQLNIIAKRVLELPGA